MSSLSQAKVFRVSGLRKHENADALMVGEFEGCPFIVNMNDTHEGDLRIFLPFDLVVPDRPDMPDFVRGKRIRPMKLRGIFSMGACIPIPEGCEAIEGEDVTERLGFTKWEPPEERSEGPDGIELQNTFNGKQCSGPNGLTLYKYDLESLRKYHKEFINGETVYITAKLHGENFTVVYWQDQFHIKSRNRWILDGDNKWWNTFNQYDFSFLKKHPGLCLIGEKYGNVSKFRYDCKDGEQRIRIFDVYDATVGKFFPVESFLQYTSSYNIDIVPQLYYGPWQGIDIHKNLTEGKSILGGDIEEGYVCEAVNQRFVYNLGRVKAKWHSEKFLLHQGKIK